jgi:hypothetical protein
MTIALWIVANKTKARIIACGEMPATNAHTHRLAALNMSRADKVDYNSVDD